MEMFPQGSLFYRPFELMFISCSSTDTFFKDSSDHFLIASQKQLLTIRKVTPLSNFPTRVTNKKNQNTHLTPKRDLFG